MEQRPRSLHVLEEADAEADALARAGDEAGDVGDDERGAARVAAAADGDDAEGRDQGGERVVGHTRPRRGDRGDEGALADVGEAEQADVGHDLQLELDLADLARVAFFGAARGAVVRCREVDVAAPALAALGHDHALAVRRHVGEELARSRVADLRADGDALFAVLAAATVAVAAVAVLAARALDQPSVGEVEERRHALVADEDDARAAAAVAARGATEGDEFLATERRRSVAAVARDDLHFALIHEPHGRGSYHALERRPLSSSLVGTNCSASPSDGVLVFSMGLRPIPRVRYAAALVPRPMDRLGTREKLGGRGTSTRGS